MTFAKFLLGVLALTCGVIVGFLVFRPDRPLELEGRPFDDHPLHRELRVEGEALPSWKPEPAPATVKIGTGSELASERPEQVEPPEPAAMEEGPPSLQVLVVRESGEPIAGISVLFCITPDRAAATWMDLARATTGDDGIARVDTSRSLEIDLGRAPNAAFFVTCELPGETAPRIEIDDPATGEPVRLVVPDAALAWLQPLRVLVVDSADSPVEGIDVLVATERANEPDQIQRVAQARTDGGGIAVFSLGELRERIAKAARFQVALRSFVTFSHPLADPPQVAIDRPTGDLIRLVLPATGSLIVRLTDAGGSTVSSGASVQLRYRGADLGDNAGMSMWKRPVDVVDGVARFERIGLGLVLGVSGWYDDGRARSAYETIAGPTAAGEEVSLTMRFGEEFPWILGRVLDATGAPIASTTIAASTRRVRAVPKDPASGPDRESHFKLSTDESGRFRHRLDGVVPAGDHRVLVLRCNGEQSADGPLSYAGIALPEPMPPGAEIDLGDLTLAPVPVLVSGRVVDVDGKPVRHAIINISYSVAGRPGSSRNLNHPNTSTDADGRFEIRYIDPPDGLEIRARRRMDTFASREFEAGATGLELVLRPLPAKEETGGVVQGMLLVENDIALDHLAVTLRAESGTRHKVNVMEHGGGFHFKVQPGTYDLEVVTHPGRELLARVDDVAVEGGVTSADSRLQSIDIRGKARYLRLRLRAPDGTAVSNENVWLDRDRGSGSPVQTDDRGRLVMLVSAARDEVALRGNRFTLECPWYDDGREVVVRMK